MQNLDQGLKTLFWLWTSGVVSRLC